MTIPGVDLEVLAGWLDDAGVPGGPLEDVEQLAGGTQNVLVRFRRAGRDLVLRRPPVHKRSNSDETMRREARVLAALAGSDVPHPGLVAACPDESVLGAAFYVMEAVDGANPTVGLPAAYLHDPAWRHELGLAMADGAAAVGAVDHEAAGLADLGRADGFLERQVERWRSQLESYAALDGYPGPEIPGVDAVGTWLDDNRPAADAWRPGLIHGDYHLANVLCAPDRPALAAIVDWELTTIGDPLLDLGWLLATWPEPGSTGGVGVTPWEGFPTADELVARYAARSDRDLSAVPWYEVLACYKLGIILEGTHARACAGKADRGIGDLLHQQTLQLFERARRRIAG